MSKNEIAIIVGTLRTRIKKQQNALVHEKCYEIKSNHLPNHRHQKPQSSRDN